MAKKANRRAWRRMAPDVEVAQTGAAHPQKEQDKQTREWYQSQQGATQTRAVDRAGYPSLAESLATRCVPDKKAYYYTVDKGSPTVAVAESLVEDRMRMDDEAQPAAAVSSIEESAQDVKPDNVDDEGLTASKNSNAESNALMDLDRYSVCERVGKGVYGVVVKAFDNARNTYVAIKSHDGLWIDALDFKRNLRELAILSRLSHPNIVRIHDVHINNDWESFDDVLIVMDLCDTDLQKIISTRAMKISEFQAKRMTYHLLLGLAYLHSAGIYHRDLKPQNCLVNKVNEDFTLKICDFGLAGPIFQEPAAMDDEPTAIDESALPPPPQLRRRITADVGTPLYRAPELLLQTRYDELVDVWSAACVLAEMLQLLPGTDSSFRNPLFGTSKREVMNMMISLLGLPTEADLEDFDLNAQKSIKADFKSYQAKSPEARRSALKRCVPGAEFEALDLMEKMFKFGPRSRMTVQGALGHAFLAIVRDESSERLPPQRLKLAFEEEEAKEEQAGPPQVGWRRCWKQEILHFKSLGA